MSGMSSVHSWYVELRCHTAQQTTPTNPHLLQPAANLFHDLCASRRCSLTPQGIKQLSGYADNTLKMAAALEQIVQAELPPLAEGLAEGSTCPCCNTTTCTSIEWGRTMALKARRAQTDQLHQTAVHAQAIFSDGLPPLSLPFGCT